MPHRSNQCRSIEQGVASHFDAVAPYWRDVYQQQDVQSVIYQNRRAVVISMVDKLRVARGADVLEIGCGAGLTAIALARRGYAVRATDIAPSMLTMTRQSAEESGLERLVQTACCDVHSMPFHSRAFDLVIAIGVLPWVPSIDKATQEIMRVLRPGAYLIVTSDNRYRATHLVHPLTLASLIWKRLPSRRRFADGPAIPTANMYSVRSFDAQLTRLGLEKVFGNTLGFGPFFGMTRILPGSLPIRLHYSLQNLADKGCPLIRSAGSQYISAWRKVG